MSKRIPFICGNWKLNHDAPTTRRVLKELAAAVANVDDVEIGIAPVTTTLALASEAVDASRVRLVAQNVHQAEKGAFTGEWSVAHLKELGVKCVIIGHSERRAYFNESDDSVAEKVLAVLDGGLTPIACCGEQLSDRESQKTFDVIGTQIDAIISKVQDKDIARLVVAYEPVWAIGTGKTASAAQAQEVHAFIRDRIRARFGNHADAVRIQYGGTKL